VQNTDVENYHDARSVELLQKSAELFFEFGYHATSMSQIADVMGLTKAGLYYYVRSKSELLFDVLNFSMDFVDHSIIEPSQKVAGAEERLSFLVERHLDSIATYGSQLTVAFDEARHLPETMRLKIERRQRIYFEFVKNILEDLKSKGSLYPRSPELAAAFVLMTIEASARWLLKSALIDRRFLIEETRQFILRGAIERL